MRATLTAIKTIKASSAVKHLLLALACLGDDGQKARAWTAELADLLGCTVRRVQQIQFDAVEADLLKIIPHRGEANEYILLFNAKPASFNDTKTKPASPQESGGVISSSTTEEDSPPESWGEARFADEGQSETGFAVVDDLGYVRALIQRAGINEPACSQLAEIAQRDWISADDIWAVVVSVRQDRTIRDPAAFLVSHIQRNGWKIHKPQREPADRNRYVGGKYADLIMH